MIRDAINPIILAGNGVARADAAPALRELARATGIGVAETFMGKGALDYEDPHALGTVGLQSRDYALAGFEDADVVITVGYDLVEHSPSNWNPKRNKKIICIDSVPSEVDEHFVTEIDLVGDLYHILSRLTEELRHEPRTRRGSRWTTSCSAASRPPRTTTRSRCSRRACCGRSARRSAATTC